MATDAIELLTNDHEEVRDLLEKLVDTTARAEKTRSRLLEQIAQALEVHTAIEEEIFYPAFREADEEHAKRVFEAREEHRAVEALVLPDLRGTDPGSEEFGGRAKVLKELVEHHAEEEEEEMFEMARDTFSDEELADLGERMARRKQELESAR